jgi:phage tail sheath gpL-like
MGAIVVPGYSSTDRIPRAAFALLLGQGSRTPAQSPLDILLVGPRSNTGTGSETFEINGTGPKTIVVTSLINGISWKLVSTVGASAVAISGGCVTMSVKDDDSCTVTAMQALIAGSAAVAEAITITGTGSDAFDNAKAFATAHDLCSAEGSASDDDPKNLYVASDATDYFGAKSPIKRMLSRLLAEYPGATVWGVCADDNATCTRGRHVYGLTGTATETRTMRFAVADTAYDVAVTTGDTNDVVGAALAAKINADAACPCYAAYSATNNELALTHAWNGPEQGFAITILVNVAGLTFGAPSDTPGTGEPDFATALDAAFLGIPSVDYVVPATDDNTVLTSGATSLKAKIAAKLAPTEGLLVTAILGNTADAYTTAHTATDAWDDGTIAYNETGYWSQLGWYSNYPAEPWCVAAALAGLRVKNEESSPRLNWMQLDGGPRLVSLGVPWLASSRATSTEINAAIAAGITPIDCEWSSGKAYVVLSVCTKHQIASADNLTYVECTNIPAVARYVSYGVRSSWSTTFSGFNVVANVDGEEPDELPTLTTCPYLMKEWLLTTMRTDYQKTGYVQRVDDHAAVTSVEQDATAPNRILYELPLDIPRWVTQIVGVHREIGGTV